MSRLRAWLRLSGEDRRGILRAWGLLALADLGLRVATLERCQRWLASMASGRRRSPTCDAASIARWVQVAARHHFLPTTCLRRALVLQALLSRFGFAPSLQVGVHTADGALAAHAWVEVDGEPIGEYDAPTKRYLTLRPSAGSP